VTRFTAVIDYNKYGYWGECPELQGCYTEGDTFEQTIENLREAIVLNVEDRLECGEVLPGSDSAPATASWDEVMKVFRVSW